MEGKKPTAFVARDPCTTMPAIYSPKAKKMTSCLSLLPLLSSAGSVWGGVTPHNKTGCLVCLVGLSYNFCLGGMPARLKPEYVVQRRGSERDDE